MAARNRKFPSSRMPSLEGVPHWLLAGGLDSLLLIALGAGIAGVIYLIKLSAAISVPLIIAFVIAVIAHPLVKLGDRIKLPRWISSAVVILIVIAVIWASVQITAVGVISQGPAIGTQLISGIKSAGNGVAHVLEGWGVSKTQITTGINNVITSVKTGGGALTSTTTTTTAGTGLTSTSTIGKVSSLLLSGVTNLASVLSSVGSFLFSFFIGAMLLFYLLTDYENIIEWLTHHLGVAHDVGIGLIEDVTHSLRGYFRGTTITAFIVTLGTGGGLALLGMPLVIPIMIVTFLTAYIPFFGAIIATLFAALVALGSGGIIKAAIAIVICLAAQNVLQNIVNNKFMGDSLDLHPLVVLVVTILGSTFGGLLGACLGAPTTAIVLRAHRRLREAQRTAVVDTIALDAYEEENGPEGTEPNA